MQTYDHVWKSIPSVGIFDVQTAVIPEIILFLFLCGEEPIDSHLLVASKVGLQEYDQLFASQLYQQRAYLDTPKAEERIALLHPKHSSVLSVPGGQSSNLQQAPDAIVRSNARAGRQRLTYYVDNYQSCYSSDVMPSDVCQHGWQQETGCPQTSDIPASLM